MQVSLEVWNLFIALAIKQLHRNLRRNGLKRRLLPSGPEIHALIRLGAVTRIIDEVAMESPMPASAIRTSGPSPA